MPADPTTTAPRAAPPARVWIVAVAEIGLLAVAATLKASAVIADTPLSTTGGLLANFLLVLAIGSLGLALPTRGRRRALLCVTIGLSCLFIVDQVHHRAFREFFSLRELGHAAQLAGLLASILPYLRWTDLGFLADWPLWIALARRQPVPTSTAPPAPSATSAPTARTRCLVAAFAVAAAFSAYLTQVRDFLIAPRTGRTLVVNRRFTVRETGVLGFHLFDGIDLIRARPAPRIIRPDDLQEVQRWLAAHRASGPDTGAIANAVPFGATHGANLLFLQLESFEAFVLGLTVNGQEITPRLNRLRDEAWHFNRFFPQSGVGTTSDAEFCALNSLLPALDDVVARRDAHNTFRALPSLLAAHGYQTIAMSVCRPDLWNMGWMHWQYGFEHRHYYEEFCDRTGEDPLKITDDRFFARARELLRATPEPFFAHLMTISTHAPFTYLPADWKKPDLGPWQGGVLGNYLQAAHFVDHAVGQFLDHLRADGVLDRTVVFIYGDHEALPFDLRQKIRPLETDAIGARLDDRLRRRVPLLIRIPGHSQGHLVDRLSGQVDLSPTALYLLGLRDASAVHLGRNVFEGTNAPGFVCFRSGAFATDGRFFNSPDGRLSTGGCEPIQPGATVDPIACETSWMAAQEYLRISDLILEQDMLRVIAPVAMPAVPGEPGPAPAQPAAQ